MPQRRNVKQPESAANIADIVTGKAIFAKINASMVKYLLMVTLLAISGCQFKTENLSQADVKNEIRHAKGLDIQTFDGYSVVTVSSPWPNSSKNYQYVLRKKDAQIPTSLVSLPTINVPVKSIVVTSTTHIPSLEMLGTWQTLVGFPHLDYISSDKVRAHFEAGKVRELGVNQNLNTELLVDMQPDVIIGYGIDNSNPTLENLKRNGLKVIINGDWNEKTPLGKAEWIKLFGALYGLEAKADSIFSKIESDYNQALAMAKKVTKRPTVLSGALYENRWTLPQGDSWAALLIRDAGGKYLWADTKGTGSLTLSYEQVLEKAQNADFWISPGYFRSMSEIEQNNPHYKKFKAFQAKNVFSFTNKTGKSGGVLYYELGQNRPDLVLKDVIKVLHPELLPNYQPFFFQRLP